MNNDKEYNFILMNLEEEDSPNFNRNINDLENIISKDKNNSNSSDSFFKKIFNSVGKIGQGLRNIMYKKINIEEDDNNDFYQDTYEQVSNRFNRNEEISLIDAPSFMEESHSKINNTIQNEKENENENKKEEISNMIISNNQIKKDENEYNSFNKYMNNSKEEIINTDFLRKSGKNYKIKSTLLNNSKRRKK